MRVLSLVVSFLLMCSLTALGLSYVVRHVAAQRIYLANISPDSAVIAASSEPRQ